MRSEADTREPVGVDAMRRATSGEARYPEAARDRGVMMSEKGAVYNADVA